MNRDRQIDRATVEQWNPSQLPSAKWARRFADLREDWLRQGEALQAARTTWRELAPHLPAEWDGGDLGYLVSDMDAVLAEAGQQ